MCPMKHEVKQIIGKKICGVVVKQGTRTPRSQVFLLFTDDTYYEFYSDSDIIGTGGVDPGGLNEVRAYMSNQKITLEYYRPPEDLEKSNQ